MQYSLKDSVGMKLKPTTSSADAIKELMVTSRLTESDFAYQLQITRQQLSRIIAREAIMSLDVAERIQIVTGVSARWLLQLDVNYTQKPKIFRRRWA